MKKGMVMPRFNICIYFQVSSIEDRKKKGKKGLMDAYVFKYL